MMDHAILFTDPSWLYPLFNLFLKTAVSSLPLPQRITRRSNLNTHPGIQVITLPLARLLDPLLALTHQFGIRVEIDIEQLFGVARLAGCRCR